MNQSQRNPGVQKGAEGGGRKGKGVKAKTGQLFLLVDSLGKSGLPGQGASEGRTAGCCLAVRWL